ncbi:MAG: hypothetical protein BWY78_01301 [Alphaproteobacteria bacterium ADurb.Bin438]|nr:MAG: hypothetical protein BWY78_01301 [Alphaproteobacteria bacterium ADurb.Bin438]
MGAGGYRSIFKGRGMEFDEVRIYQQGDDIRAIDWRVTARRGEAYTKLYQEEREKPVFILADLRPRMRFATKGAYKSVISAKIASLVAWSAYGRGDKVGGTVLSCKKGIDFSPKKDRKKVFAYLNALSLASCEEDEKTENNLAEALMRTKRVSKAGGMIFVISDFHDFNDEAKKQFSDISLKNEVFFINIIDPIEEDLPKGSYQVSNGDEIITLYADDKNFMNEYRNYFKKKRDDLQSYCDKKRIKLVFIKTNDDLAEALRKGIMKSGRK